MPAVARDEEALQFDAAMSASDRARLAHADFESLSASEFLLVERLAREIALPWPCMQARRLEPAAHGTRLDWRRTARDSVRHGGELVTLAYLSRRLEPFPVLILIDVSGSMERYARLMLAFLHQSTRKLERSVFAFGNQLTDLTKIFRWADTDAMLDGANRAIHDFAGGTQIGHCLSELRQAHHRHLVGRRTVVLFISDGLDTGSTDNLRQELSWLKRNSRSLLWLNPLLRYEQYQPVAEGASVLNKFSDRMLAIHNLAQLSELARSMANLLKQ